MRNLKKIIFTTIKWIAAIYAIGYVIFGYPNDAYLMRATTGIMLTIFSINVLIYLFKSIERKLKIKTETF